MEAFLFALNAVAPIMLMTIIGYVLNRTGLIKDNFASGLNKLVFKLFLPAMLFLNVYNIKESDSLDITYIFYVLLIIVAVFLVSIPLVILITKNNSRRGALLQATFRSNCALIGIPVGEALFGATGALVATLLSAAIIPVYNVLGVISLSLFNGSKKPSVKKILLDIIKNPLIESIALGFLCLAFRSFFLHFNIAFRLDQITPLMKTLEYLSGVATPLALVSLGAGFRFSAIKELRREIIFGVIMRVVIVPFIGIGVAYMIKNHFWDAHFAAFVAVFATPVAVSTVPMAEAMGSDSSLAGQLVIWSTLFSSLSIFVASYLLKLLGIF